MPTAMKGNRKSLGRYYVCGSSLRPLSNESAPILNELLDSRFGRKENFE